MNPILFYDTETTGLPDWKVPSESEHQPHIVQLAAVLADADSQDIISGMDIIVKPDGWEIPQEMTDIHGVSHDMAMSVGVPEKMAVEMFLGIWNGIKRVAHNRTFDQRIIRIATKRYCGTEATDAWADKDSHECTMLMAKPIMQLLPKNRFGFKSPNLSEAYKHFTGKDHVNAHMAMADTMACMEIYWEMVNGKEEKA